MVILSTKLRNAIRKYSEDMRLEYYLHDMMLYGRKTGCTGFIKNRDTGTIMYVNTEVRPMSSYRYLYKYADNFNDYHGYHNRWAETLDGLAEGVSRCLRTTPQAVGDRRI